MQQPFSARRLAENEVYFRERNRAIEEQYKQIKEIAKEDGQESLIHDDDLVLQFFCECSDEDCRKRIPLRRSQYDQLHKNNNVFVVVCGHEIPEYEFVIERGEDYCIIRKKNEPPLSASKLNPSPVSNT
ncbi:hypothetical protein CYG49_01415 [Candidatus Saccharibacteria bacterium]|nr:MAG: hypothetical protein CYG49_01415 [Candidatus Saccharibacteria bacterium]